MKEMTELEYEKIINDALQEEARLKDNHEKYNIKFLSLTEYQILKTLKSGYRLTDITVEVNRKLGDVLKKQHLMQTVKKSLERMVKKGYIEFGKNKKLSKTYSVLPLGEEKILEFEMAVTKFYL